MTIDRVTFMGLIKVTRKYWNTADTDYLDRKINLCYDLEAQSGVNWNIISDISDAIARLNVPDDKVDQILNLFGFTID